MFEGELEAPTEHIMSEKEVLGGKYTIHQDQHKIIAHFGTQKRKKFFVKINYNGVSEKEEKTQHNGESEIVQHSFMDDTGSTCMNIL